MKVYDELKSLSHPIVLVPCIDIEHIAVSAKCLRDCLFVWQALELGGIGVSVNLNGHACLVTAVSRVYARLVERLNSELETKYSK